MDKSLIIRNLITSVLNQDNDALFRTTLQFFYDLEDAIIRDNQLNIYLKSRINTTARNLLYNIFLNTYSGEENILFFQNFNIKLDKYLQSDHSKADVGDILFPIHSIFYRFFIKGGSALKVFVDNLQTLGIIGQDIPFIPNIAIDPTDIDSNIIVNPSFPEVIELTQILKQVIKNVSLKMFEKYNNIYWEFNKQLIRKIENNDDFLKKISALFNNKNMFFTLPSNEQYSISLPNNGYSIKPENSCVRFTLLNTPICIVRLLLCIDIYESQVNIQEEDKGLMGIPNSTFITHAEAELIDITVYEIDNPKYNDIWQWAKQTLPYDRRHTLFQGIHDMIVDIIQMNASAEATRNPSLLAKVEKRSSRLDYLYFLYCNYRLIQIILENKNEINEKHVIEYCHKLVELPFLQLGLSKKQVNEILPYIIGKVSVDMDKIIMDFIKNYIFVDQSFQYELSNKTGYIISSKLDKSSYKFIFPENALKLIQDYLISSIPTVSKRSSTLSFVYLVEGYKETYIDGNTLFIYMCAILDSIGVSIGQFAATVRTTYDTMVKSVKLQHNDLIQSNRYFQIIRKNPVPKNFPTILLQENIGRLCTSIIDQCHISCDIVILNKYAPFKLLCIPKIDINIFQFLESIFEIINEYLKKLKATYLILYELTPEFLVNVYFKFVYTKTIKSINVQGDVDIHFCRLILKFQNLPQNIIPVYQNDLSVLYQNL